MSVALPGHQSFGPENGIRHAHIEVSWSEYLHVQSGVMVDLVTFDVVTLMSRSDDELGHPVYEPYRTFISAGIVADRGAAKNFMAELGSMCEAAEYLGGEDTKCHPECYCQCVDQYRDRLSACAATFIVCIEASLVYLVGGIAVCAIGCMAGGPLWQPCLMACLRMVAMKKIKQILGACMAAYGACKMIQDEFLVGCSNDC